MFLYFLSIVLQLVSEIQLTFSNDNNFGMSEKTRTLFVPSFNWCNTNNKSIYWRRWISENVTEMSKTAANEIPFDKLCFQLDFELFNIPTSDFYYRQNYFTEIHVLIFSTKYQLVIFFFV